MRQTEVTISFSRPEYCDERFQEFSIWGDRHRPTPMPVFAPTTLHRYIQPDFYFFARESPYWELSLVHQCPGPGTSARSNNFVHAETKIDGAQLRRITAPWMQQAWRAADKTDSRKTWPRRNVCFRFHPSPIFVIAILCQLQAHFETSLKKYSRLLSTQLALICHTYSSSDLEGLIS